MAIINLPKRDRKCKNGFLVDYLEFTKDQESPEDFHCWVGISLIGSALRRNCYMKRGTYTLYPNLYVVVVAESAALHKSTALNIGVEVLRESNPEHAFFSQKITTESFIHFLHEQFEETQTSVAIVHASEFAVFFGKSISDPTLLQTLTDMYDNPSYWSYSTLTRGKEECNNVCINMLAATTPEWIKTSLPEDALGGGFTSRLLFIPRYETDRSNPFPEDTMDEATLKHRANCVHDLGLISGLRGNFSWDALAKRHYAEWYEGTLKHQQHNAMPGLRGYYGRKGDTVIKLCMISSVSHDDSMNIQIRDVESAIKLLNENEQYLPQVLNFIAQTDVGKRNIRVLNLIKKHKDVPHSKLLQSISHQMSGMELRDVIDTLEQTGEIKSEGLGRARKYTYIGKGRA